VGIDGNELDLTMDDNDYNQAVGATALNLTQMKRDQYQFELRDHINKMVEASKEGNRFMFKFAYDEFQLFAKENWTQVDYDIDFRTKKKIEDIFLIENSNSFNMFKYLSNQLDPFMRFAFIQTFQLYITTQFGWLFGSYFLNLIGGCIFLFSWAFYLFIHLKRKMEMLPDKERTWGHAISFYLMLRCCFPKKKKFVGRKKKKTEE
jgi:hypothetical protein